MLMVYVNIYHESIFTNVSFHFVLRLPITKLLKVFILPFPFLGHITEQGLSLQNHQDAPAECGDITTNDILFSPLIFLLLKSKMHVCK